MGASKELLPRLHTIVHKLESVIRQAQAAGLSSGGEGQEPPEPSGVANSTQGGHSGASPDHNKGQGAGIPPLTPAGPKVGFGTPLTNEVRLGDCLENIRP